MKQPQDELKPGEGGEDIEALLSPHGIGASRRAQMIEDALDQMEAGKVRTLRWRGVGIATGTLAAAAAFALAVLPFEPEFTPKGGGEVVHAELLCRRPSGDDRCGPGASLLLSLEPPEDAPFVRAVLRSPDGSFNARFPSEGAPALDGRIRSEGVLSKKFMFDASDRPGIYSVEISFYRAPNDSESVQTIVRTQEVGDLP